MVSHRGTNLPRSNYNSILFSNSFNASNSSLDRVTPLPIFSPSGDHSRRSYLGSRSFQHPHPSSPKYDKLNVWKQLNFYMLYLGEVPKAEGVAFTQPDADLESIPIFLMIPNLNSDIVPHPRFYRLLG